jgi:hypothetical protein
MLLCFEEQKTKEQTRWGLVKCLFFQAGTVSGRTMHGNAKLLKSSDHHARRSSSNRRSDNIGTATDVLRSAFLFELNQSRT